MKVMLDTNIIVSAFLNPKGAPGEMLSLVLAGTLTVCYDNKILAEYTEVLTRSKFDFDRVLVNDFLEFIKTNGEYTIAESQNIPFTDEDDKIFYDVLKSGKAECIITGNTKHYPREQNILTPKEFIKAVNGNENPFSKGWSAP